MLGGLDYRNLFTAAKRALLALLQAEGSLNGVAAGDGVTDDTAKIQAVLTAIGLAGGGIVRGVPGKTYLVSFVGTKSINGNSYRYCLLIPDSVTFDLNGSTLKLANDQNAAILLNATAGTTQNVDVTVKNGILDGNEVNQTSATQDFPCIFLADVLRPRVEQLKVVNARDYFGQFFKCDQGYFNNLHGRRSDGDGWRFGISSNSNHVTNSFIDNVYAEDCSAAYAGSGTHVGNGAIFTTKYCSTGKVETYNCAAAIKVQDDSTDSTFAQLFFRGGANNTANGGVNIQGTAGQKNLLRVSVALAMSTGAHSEGFRVTEAKDCAIGQYIGNVNGVTGDERDVFFDECHRLQVASISSTGCGNTNGPTVRIDDNCIDYQIGRIAIYNAGQRAVEIGSVGYGTIEAIDAYDDQGAPTLTEALAVTSTTARGMCGRVRSSRAVTTTPIIPVKIGVINTNYEVGKIESGSTDALEGVVTLTNGAASTDVVCNHIYKSFSGTSGTDHYFHPIIEVTPWIASAGALVGTSQFRTVVVRDITGTGFAIKHPNAGAADYVHWKVVGWKVCQREQA